MLICVLLLCFISYVNHLNISRIAEECFIILLGLRQSSKSAFNAVLRSLIELTNHLLNKIKLSLTKASSVTIMSLYDNASNMSEDQGIHLTDEDAYLWLYSPFETVIIIGIIPVAGTMDLLANLAFQIAVIRNPDLQTKTNYYLFSLAIFDEITIWWRLRLVYWRLHRVTCKLCAALSKLLVTCWYYRHLLDRVSWISNIGCL